METAEKKPVCRRRWLRFSLRMFLISLVVVGISLGWIMNRAEKQKRVVQWVKENGGTVDFGNDVTLDRILDEETNWKKILSDTFGDEYVYTVRGVSFFLVFVEDLSPLVDLPHLEYLGMSWLGNDFESLAKLKNLKSISIWEEFDKDKDMKLRKALPNCEIIWNGR